MNYTIHKYSDVQSKKIGKGTIIWQFVVVLPEAKIGINCNINAHVFIENDVLIGNNVTVKSGTQIWNGVTLEDFVFIGPNVTFTNDLVPKSKKYPTIFEKTIVKKGASIGANATIIAGNVIGANAMIGAGSVVTKNVPKNELWIGNPARKVGYVSNDGDILDLHLFSKKSGKKHEWSNGNLVIKEWLNFPISNQIYKEVLSLPISPVINDKEIIKVISFINSFNKEIKNPEC